MSDGPHRSLQMRNGWRKLAERGDGKLHSIEQVREAVPSALADDWQHDRCTNFLSEVRAILIGGDQGSLFEPSVDQTLDAIRDLDGAGYPFRRIIADTITQALEDGYSGEQAIVRGVADALAIRCAAGARQVEEHYLRTSNESRAADVRSRIQNAAATSDFAAMARQFCKMEKAPSPNKYDGVDHGVSIL